MTDYLFIFRGGMAASGTAPSPETMQKHMAKWTTWVGDLTKSGKSKGGQPLQPTGKSMKGKKRTVTDGPYAEAKDLISGYLTITAKDLDEAVALAEGCPIFDYDGSVEVRPIMSIGK